MQPTDAELLTARLARMKLLIKSLERVCAQTANLRYTFHGLKSETDAIRASLRPVDS